MFLIWTNQLSMLILRFPLLNNGTLHSGMLYVTVAFNAFITKTLSSLQKSTESLISFALDIAFTCAVNNTICVANALSAGAAVAPEVATGGLTTPTGTNANTAGAAAAANACTKAVAVRAGAGV